MAIYVGVNGQARKVKAAYIGNASGQAQPIYKSDVLPDGYQQVEYISNESSDNYSYGPYITSFLSASLMSPYTRIVLNYSARKGNPYGAYYNDLGLFYSSGSSSSNYRTYVSYSSIHCYLGSKDATQSNLTEGTKYQLDFNNKGLVKLGTTTILTNTTIGSNYGDLGLFANASTIFLRLYDIKIYQHYNYNTILKEAYPCYTTKQITNNGITYPIYTAGLYDIINNIFYSSDSTSYEFYAGPVLTV